METRFEKLRSILNNYFGDVDNLEPHESDSSIFLNSPGNDKIFQPIFINNSPQVRKEQPFYQYKKYEFGLEILSSGCLIFSALSNYQSQWQDADEYKHFYELIKFKADENYIDSSKRNLFITCLTDKKNNSLFWEEYADKNKGICIEFKIKFKENNGAFDFRKVSYDDGSKMERIKKFQEETFNLYNKYAMIESHAKFSVFYKRSNYEWESEYRMFINNCVYNLPSDLKKREFENGKIILIDVPFSNNYFEAKIISVTLGNKMNPLEKEKMKNIIKTNYPFVEIYELK